VNRRICILLSEHSRRKVRHQDRRDPLDFFRARLSISSDGARERSEGHGKKWKKRKVRNPEGHPTSSANLPGHWLLRSLHNALSVGGQHRRGWEPLNRGVPVVPLVECGPARCVRVHIDVYTHYIHKETHTNKRIVL